MFNPLQIDEETEEDEEVTDEYPDTVATVPTVTVAPDYSEEYGQEASSSSSTILPDVQGVWSEISELPSENPITYTESPITESTAPAPETSPETAPEITPERGSSAENELYPTEIAPENVEKPTELAPDLSETTENTENQWLPDVVETSQVVHASTKCLLHLLLALTFH